MPTQCQSGLFDRHARVVFLRVHVPSGDRHITVPCEISERPWVHERRPTRQARVPEGVEREGVEREVSHTRERTCPRVLALQTRRLNVAALRRRRENPWP